MSKMKNLFMLSSAMLAIAMNNGIVPIEKRRVQKRKILTDKEKEHITKQYTSEQHEYIIKGVKIIAPNKKVAIKIYNKK